MPDLEQYLIYKFTGQPLWEKIAKAQLGKVDLSLNNLRGGSPAFALAALRESAKYPLIAVAPSNQAAENLYDDLYFLKVKPLFHFPEWDTLPYDSDEPVIQVIAKTWELYEYLLQADDSKRSNSDHPIIVTSAPALMYRLAPLAEFSRRSLALEWGQRIDTEKLSGQLTDAGYEPFAIVESRGEFSMRGGIIDIFPPHYEHPIRVDLFGDEIESMRYFDVQSQRTHKGQDAVEKVLIPPANLRKLRADTINSGIELAALDGLIPPHSIFAWLEPDRCREEMLRFQEVIQRNHAETINSAGKSAIPAPELMFAGATESADKLEKRHAIQLNRLPVEEHSSRAHSASLHIGSFEDVKPQFEHYLQFLQQKWHAGNTIVIVCDNDGQIQRLSEVLEEKEIEALPMTKGGRDDLPETFMDISRLQPVILCTGDLHQGFTAPDSGLVILTDREIFGRYKRAHVYRKIHKGKVISSLEELKRGDFVVHVEHGIGRFLGLRQQTIDNRTVDLIEILYAESNKLLVPTHNIQYVQKYTAIEGLEPSLDRLGSSRWQQRRRKAQEEIEQMADELLALYAEREMARAHPCSQDTIWQNEFEASFLYDETPDQLKAIIDSKQDLEKDKPADRLVCGDVGFGKTEVAMRAAFKMVQEHKQVAVLCPTTILADQHYRTFSQRFADYPYKIEVISRFKTDKEAKGILKKLKMAEVDIIIGTHRLLSNDVQFNDLGLLIVDEEQRFGVRHKEKIKSLKKAIHVVTLTATPIPRTLYLALSGLRDLSVIYTPPANRIPIKTKIIHWDKPLIEEALLRELNRGGQVYFVHNRIHSIQEVVDSIHDIVPKARIRHAHGQMNESELEKVIMDFVDCKFDILVSTTIIENGIDIPNVNTILINRADSFGLAQLYQLRGRVGRESQQAYAYLIVPKGQAITDNAVKRLTAIEEFTELGSGFQIALRDMEIRGTGNILGKEQHGTIAAIGFELYCSMLQETVDRMRGEARDEKPKAEIRWKVDSFIPQDFIPLETQRVGVYKNLANARSLQDIIEIEDELKDRFGDLPKPVENLMLLGQLQILARDLDITEIFHGPAGIYFKISRLSGELDKQSSKAVNQIKTIQRLKVDQNGVIQVELKKELAPKGMLRLAVDFLKLVNAQACDSPSKIQEIS